MARGGSGWGCWGCLLSPNPRRGHGVGWAGCRIWPCPCSCQGEGAQAELEFGIWSLNPTHSRLGTAGMCHPGVTSWPSPSLGQIRDLTPSGISTANLLKMIKSKEKRPKSLKRREVWDPSSTDPLQGWSHPSPSPLDTDREDQSPLSHCHPPKFGIPLSQPSPGSLTLRVPAPRSLRAGTDHGTGDSSSFILSLREVAPPGRWSSPAPAGSILPILQGMQG